MADRLISADDLIERAYRLRLDDRERVAQMIESAPTVDAVPVVRCKDCKWWNTTEHEKCVAYDAFWVTDPDDFCCWGERREQDEKDCERCLQVTERPGNDICKACGGRRGQDATRMEENDLRDLRE